MLKFYKVTTTVFIQVLFALTTAGIIIALYDRDLYIALACALAKSLLHAIWKYTETLVFFTASDEKEDEA